jgi:hypothetical protein
MVLFVVVVLLCVEVMKCSSSNNCKWWCAVYMVFDQWTRNRWLDVFQPPFLYCLIKKVAGSISATIWGIFCHFFVSIEIIVLYFSIADVHHACLCSLVYNKLYTQKYQYAPSWLKLLYRVTVLLKKWGNCSKLSKIVAGRVPAIKKCLFPIIFYLSASKYYASLKLLTCHRFWCQLTMNNDRRCLPPRIFCCDATELSPTPMPSFANEGTSGQEYSVSMTNK